MKIKLFTIIFFLFLINFIFSITNNEKKQIKVVIEAEEDLKERGVTETKPYIIWEKYDKEQEIKKLKSTISQSKIEQEVLDALISKIVDLEVKIKNLEFFNIIIIILFLFNLILLFLIIRKK